MLDVVDIRKEQNLNFVLPEDDTSAKDAVQTDDAAVFAYLYYEDSLSYYLPYLKNASNVCRVYISTSNENTKTAIEDFIEAQDLGNRVEVLSQENRGRDVRALLITFRDYIHLYNKICFIHDKRAKSVEIEVATQKWISDLWDNTLLSEGYIRNILRLLNSNEQLGLLVPPETMADHFEPFYKNMWLKNYDLTVDLAKRLRLSVLPDKTKSPVTLGTVFWAKTAALDKLFEYPWKPEDFPTEPMPDDGTISHCIERILAYVALDQGYWTGNVQSLAKAEERVYDIYQLTKEILRSGLN